jgi:hypothetical protein
MNESRFARSNAWFWVNGRWLAPDSAPAGANLLRAEAAGRLAVPQRRNESPSSPILLVVSNAARRRRLVETWCEPRSRLPSPESGGKLAFRGQPEAPDLPIELIPPAKSAEQEDNAQHAKAEKLEDLGKRASRRPTSCRA